MSNSNIGLQPANNLIGMVSVENSNVGSDPLKRNHVRFAAEDRLTTKKSPEVQGSFKLTEMNRNHPATRSSPFINQPARQKNYGTRAEPDTSILAFPGIPRRVTLKNVDSEI